MGKAVLLFARSKPLLFKSKTLCFSILYFITTLIITIYISISPTNKCRLFGTGVFDPIQSPLFSYPSSYGQHKHPLPTFRPSCSSPLFFSDYSTVLREMRKAFKDKEDLPTRYMEGKGDAFGGNFSLEKRIAFMDQFEQGKTEYPCGFFKTFPINVHDREQMRSCDGMVVVSAIFGDHDKIRQPKGVGSKSLDLVCFFMFVDDHTLRGLLHHNLISQEKYNNGHGHKIGAWRLVNVSSESLYKNAAMNGVIPKYLVHRLFPNTKYSIWVDAKLQLAVDPLLLVHSLVVNEEVDMAISKHPFFTHTMEEAMATTRWRKWVDIEGIKTQMEAYCQHGLRPWSRSKLPYPSDVPDTALIIRKHGLASNVFSCLMFNELGAFNHRDQLAFAFVRDKLRRQLKINMFDPQVFEQIVLEFRHNLKPGEPSSSIKRAHPDFHAGGGLGRCEGYFLEMWGESHI